MADQVLDSFLHRAKALELSPSHVSLFLALYVISKNAGHGKPFRISRKRVMPMARLHSTGTYHRKLGELVAHGIISYSPSWHPFLGSEVRLL